MKILLFSSPVTDVWPRAFRRHHEAVTAGITGTGEYDVQYDLLSDTAADIVERASVGGVPDLCLLCSIEYFDFPRGLEECPVPTVALFSDYNLCFDAMRRAAPYVDLAICDEEELVGPLRANGANQVLAMPWFGLDEERFRPLTAEKVHDVTFVGNVNPLVQRRRGKTLEKVMMWGGERVHVATEVYGEEYVRLLSQSRIVFNQSIRGELNMRVYETMGCGSLAVLEESNSQVRRFFEDREHLVLYNDDNLLDVLDYYLDHDEEREQIAAAGRAEALAGHTYTHRAEGILALARESLLNGGLGRRRASGRNTRERVQDLAAVWFYQGRYDAAASLCAEDQDRSDAQVIAAHASLAAGERDDVAPRLCEVPTLPPLQAFNLLSRAVFAAHAEGKEGGEGPTLDQVVQGFECLIRRLESSPSLRIEHGLIFPTSCDRLRLEWEKALFSEGYDAAGSEATRRALLLWRSCERLGDCFTTLSDHERARAAYEAAANCLSDDGYVLAKLAQACEWLGDRRAAEQNYRRALEREPFYFAAQLNLAVLLRDFGRTEEAARMCDRALRTHLDRLNPCRQHFEVLAQQVGRAAQPCASPGEELSLDEALRRVAHSFEGDEASIRALQRGLVGHFSPGDEVLDVGCGPGLFLELLRERGCLGRGIDVDPAVVAQARAKGLHAEEAEALAFLRECHDCFDGVFASCIIEHLNGVDAVELLRLCHRALRPGGKLVLVTSNYANPPVRDEVFWLDVTHVRPYPLQLLVRMCEAVGLQAIAAAPRDEGLKDLVVVAQKRGVRRHPASSSQAKEEVSVLWASPLFDPSGYADEARQFVLGLDALKVPVRVSPFRWSDLQCDLPEPVLARLQALCETPLNGNSIHVHHNFPPNFSLAGTGKLRIGRTMFETDRLPETWVPVCNQMDEVWVPTEFNVGTFSRSGVDPDRLFVVPSPIDTSVYGEDVAPLAIPERRGFNFLSVFDWSLRKGWDVLLRAYLTEFSADEDVALLLKVYSSYHEPAEALHEQVKLFAATEVGADLDRAPDIIFLDGVVPLAVMPSLFRSADAYVMPSRAEGWGRPFMEAMALGLPTIGTRWSGNTEFMTDENSYLIDVESLVTVPDSALLLLPTYRGHRWANPSVEHLRQLMRHVFENREEARGRGEVARRQVREKYDTRIVARRIVERLKELA